MLTDRPVCRDPGKFRELSALAETGALTGDESLNLSAHLDSCEECREITRQYRVLAVEGMPTLATTYAEKQEASAWDDTSTRRKLFSRIHADQYSTSESRRSEAVPSAIMPASPSRRRFTGNPLVQALLAACLVAAVTAGAYLLGLRGHRMPPPSLTTPSVDESFKELSAEKQSGDKMLAAQAKQLALLQAESTEKEQELASLRSQLRALGDHSNELAVANNQSAGKLQDVSLQRDALSTQVQSANQAYQAVSLELANLRAERDKTVLRTNSLESRIEELSAVNREQERKLKDTEQYLVSDRDIRELMGARKLYIADVFDVDSGSQTRKPFGRVFYTQGKSLIFYAFDLDRQPGIINANAFQVWGQRETAQGEEASPMNLGILYMDNETNRRWVMRFDDPKQLAEIDAVFVTVEPRGGSQKPTGKRFLYALLRNEVNHP
jgi:Anti-sigma-K factor rskA